MKNFCFAALAVFGLVAMHSGAAHAQAMVSMDIKLNTSSPIYIGNLMGLTVESTSGYTAGPPVSYYNSPGAITWSSQTTSICTVPATGNNDFSVNNNKAPATQTITVTTIKPGKCVIKVDHWHAYLHLLSK